MKLTIKRKGNVVWTQRMRSGGYDVWTQKAGEKAKFDKNLDVPLPTLQEYLEEKLAELCKTK